MVAQNLPVYQNCAVRYSAVMMRTRGHEDAQGSHPAAGPPRRAVPLAVGLAQEAGPPPRIRHAGSLDGDALTGSRDLTCGLCMVAAPLERAGSAPGAPRWVGACAYPCASGWPHISKTSSAGSSAPNPRRSAQCAIGPSVTSIGVGGHVRIGHQLGLPPSAMRPRPSRKRVASIGHRTLFISWGSPHLGMCCVTCWPTRTKASSYMSAPQPRRCARPRTAPRSGPPPPRRLWTPGPAQSECSRNPCRSRRG